MNEVHDEIKRTGTYFQTIEELTYACKVAWRNAPRCINRIQWNRMEVIDCRKVTTAEGIFEKCLEHLRFATNRGNIITTISVFAQQKAGQPPPRIWNSQLLRYAGYRQLDGSVIGDPANIEMTEAAQKLGWVGEGTMFDILPLVIQMPGEEAKLFSIPQEDVLVVQIQHPKYEWFEDLKLQWFAVPFVSNIGLTCGGVQYTCAPFNGWFMGTELSRNLGDPQRLNMLPTIASQMGLDPAGPPSSLWQEKANIELNIAILHSFQRSRVSMVDHHTAAAGFLNFWDAENNAGRAVPGDWVWLVPPCTGSVSPLFHLEMANWLQKPAYFPMDFPGKNYNYPRTEVRRSNITIKGLGKLAILLGKFMAVAYGRRHQVKVLYATETGNSERYAQRLAKFLSRVAAVTVVNMENYDFTQMEKEEVVILVASTFGSGDPPSNGVPFKEQLDLEGKWNLRRIQFAVFGLGSTLYTDFAAFGTYLDKRMARLGANRIIPLSKGDEIAGSELAFKTWMTALWAALSPLWGISMADYTDGLKSLGVHSNGSDVKSKYSSNYQLVPSKPKPRTPVINATYSRNNPYMATLKENMELLKDNTGDRSTRKIVLEVQPNAVKFNAGDHLAVLPSNRQELVVELMELLHVKDADEYFEFKPINSDNTLSTPFTTQPFTLREAFTDYIDITSPPKPDLLDIFAHFAVHPGDKAQLQDLATGLADYESWLHHHNPTLPELLTIFPVSVPLTLLLEKLPHLQPRFYSISSSPRMFSNEIHLTVSVVKYHTPSGKQHHGVASTFLAHSQPGTTMRVFTRHSDFVLPQSPSIPVIMVGPGTGVAPFRSFWQDRAFMQNLGPAALFFGCRSSAHDFIYEAEIAAALAQGSLTHVSVAFSRETEKRVYVQDLMMKEKDLVWDLLKDGAYIYVCGDINMANDVEDILKQILQAKGMGIQAAIKFIEELLAAKRYLIDVFGPTLHVGKSIGTAKDRAMNKTFKTSTSAQFHQFQKRLSHNDNLTDDENFSTPSTPRNEGLTPRNDLSTPKSEGVTPRNDLSTPRNEGLTLREALATIKEQDK
eukprot:Phypoly_transcript_00480.p1 GENE.Phypoly_transcript_00480~~Phypoly_transcript_00480.p1  ORF type:complete len:1057 (-),score=141.02 Phypoly_transcript_00480:1379-4549(-)